MEKENTTYISDSFKTKPILTGGLKLTIKFLNIKTPQINYLYKTKIGTVWFYNEIMCPKGHHHHHHGIFDLRTG